MCLHKNKEKAELFFCTGTGTVFICVYVGDKGTTQQHTDSYAAHVARAGEYII